MSHSAGWLFCKINSFLFFIKWINIFTKYANDGVIISNLLEQPYIFEYDYVKMKLNMDTLREELIQKTMHPSRVCKIIEEGYDEML